MTDFNEPGEERESMTEEDHEREFEEAYNAEDEGPAGFIVPEYEVEENPNIWHGFMPPKEEGGEPVYIEGVLPNTVLTLQAMQAIPKKLSRSPLIAMKESQENLIRLCIRKIGKEDVKFAVLRGKGLDTYLSAKQMHYVVEYFDKITTPEETEVDDFLATIRTGRRK